MVTLVCLLSEQHVPNLLSVHHYRPDRLVLVTTPRMVDEKRHRNLLAALAEGGLSYRFGGNCETWHLPGENSVRTALAELQRQCPEEPAGQWIANVTGATKPMSIAAYTFFRAKGARLIYINLPNPDVLIDLETDATERCGHRPGVREFLQGYGWKVRGKCEPSAWADQTDWRAWWDCARSIAQRCPSCNLVGETQGSGARWWQCEDEAITECVNTTLGRTSRVGDDVLCLPPKQREFLEGKWLEAFVAGLIERVREANEREFWDVRVGVEVAPKLGDDMDVVFLRQHKLHYVECKSGAQAGESVHDQLHKIEAKSRKFGAARAMVTTLLVTRSREVAEKPDLREMADARAAAYNCRIIDYRAIRRLAEGANDPSLARTILFT